MQVHYRLAPVFSDADLKARFGNIDHLIIEIPPKYGFTQFPLKTGYL
jgi:hypothetical protein